jgi:S1-C subfamily serine protease
MRPFRVADGPSIRVAAQPKSPERPKEPRPRRTLGISLQELTPLEARSIPRPERSRLRVTATARGTDDVRAGDFILTVGGEEVHTVAQVLTRILAAQGQPTVPVKLWREGREVDLALAWKE